MLSLSASAQGGGPGLARHPGSEAGLPRGGLLGPALALHQFHLPTLGAKIGLLAERGACLLEERGLFQAEGQILPPPFRALSDPSGSKAVSGKAVRGVVEGASLLLH